MFSSFPFHQSFFSSTHQCHPQHLIFTLKYRKHSSYFFLIKLITLTHFIPLSQKLFLLALHLLHHDHPILHLLILCFRIQVQYKVSLLLIFAIFQIYLFYCTSKIHLFFIIEVEILLFFIPQPLSYLFLFGSCYPFTNNLSFTHF